MNNIKVSVICTAYNHEKYLEKCLESLVCQKTNFKYEIIIHDDASKDKTRNIINRYYDKYPDIIVPILQDVNMYSQKINIVNSIMMPKIRGEYMAFCEGDDYWCDEYKLQKQFDFMEKNKKCAICLHNTIKHDLNNQKDDICFNDWKEIHKLEMEDVFKNYKVHTSSYFIRMTAAKIPEFAWKYWFGDFIRLTMAFYRGDAIALPDVMSVYNSNNENGMTYETYKISNETRIRKVNMLKEYLIEYNQYTNGKFEKYVKDRIDNIEISILLFKYLDINNFDDFKKCREKLINHNAFNKYYKSKSIKEKLKIQLKYLNYFSFSIIEKIKKIVKKY